MGIIDSFTTETRVFYKVSRQFPREPRRVQSRCFYSQLCIRSESDQTLEWSVKALPNLPWMPIQLAATGSEGYSERVDFQMKLWTEMFTVSGKHKFYTLWLGLNKSRVRYPTDQFNLKIGQTPNQTRTESDTNWTQSTFTYRVYCEQL